MKKTAPFGAVFFVCFACRGLLNPPSPLFKGGTAYRTLAYQGAAKVFDFEIISVVLWNETKHGFAPASLQD